VAGYFAISFGLMAPCSRRDSAPW